MLAAVPIDPPFRLSMNAAQRIGGEISARHEADQCLTTNRSRICFHAVRVVENSESRSRRVDAAADSKRDRRIASNAAAGCVIDITDQNGRGDVCQLNSNSRIAANQTSGGIALVVRQSIQDLEIGGVFDTEIIGVKSQDRVTTDLAFLAVLDLGEECVADRHVTAEESKVRISTEAAGVVC